MKIVKTPQGFVLQTDMGNAVGTFATQEQAEEQKSAANFTIAKAYQESYKAGKAIGHATGDDVWKNAEKSPLFPVQQRVQRGLGTGSYEALSDYAEYAKQKLAHDEQKKTAYEEGQQVASRADQQPQLSPLVGKPDQRKEAYAQGNQASKETKVDWPKIAQAYDKIYHDDPSLPHALAAANAYERAGRGKEAFQMYSTALRHHGKDMNDDTHKIINDKVWNMAGSADDAPGTEGKIGTPGATLDAYKKAWERRDEIPGALAGAASNVVSGKAVDMMQGPPKPQTAPQENLNVVPIKHTPMFPAGQQYSPGRYQQQPGPALEYRDMDVFPKLRKPAG